jgi:hypothetical protein
MDNERLDHIASTFAQRSTRRGALRFLAAAAFGATGLTLLGANNTAAKSKNKKKGKRKGSNTGSGSSGGSTGGNTGGTGGGAGGGTTGSPAGGTTVPKDQCPVSAKTNAPICGNDPDGACDCHRSTEGNNFCGGHIATCASLRPCTSTQDCRDSVGFHFVCQAADGGACGQVCVPECENRNPY